jgi:chromosome segregation ATPase
LYLKGVDPVDVKSIKQFAEEQNVSYEAIRKQIVRYGDELKDHIVRRNRTQYLDEWAINFLKEKRKESPIVLMNMDQNEEIEALKAQVDLLKSKLLVAQDQIISLQDETKKAIESQVRYTALLEDNEAKAKRLKEAESREADLSREIEKKDDQIRTIQTEADDLRKKAEEDRETIEDLQRERDEAQKEAQSFTRSIFGFYRKK